MPSATFTANGVLRKTVTIGRTASAILKGTISRTFTANAYFGSTPVPPVLIFEDDFNRSTSPGDLGTPSGGNFERVQSFYPTPAEFYVDGSQLIVPESTNSDAELFFYIDRSAPEADILFDFYTSVSSYYEYGFQDLSDDLGFYRHRSRVYNPSGDGVTWAVNAGNGVDAHNELTLTADTMYRVRIQNIGRTTKMRVWKTVDAEPSTWDSEGDALSLVFHTTAPPYIYMSWWNTPHGESRLDNLQVWMRGVQINGTLTANAVLATAGPTVVGGTFTANAYISGPFDRHAGLFYADAAISGTDTNSFTANARIVTVAAGSFTANGNIRQLVSRTFTSNAVIFRVPEPPEESRFSKSVTLQVSRRRDRALSTFVPPRSTEEQEQEPTISDPPCLPPCPPGFGGPGSLYGANGGAIRKTIIYCANCGGNFFHSEDNRLGKGDSASTTHCGCTSSHSALDHTARMWVTYPAVPQGVFQMRSKMLWRGTADRVDVKVFANAHTPDIDPEDCLPYDPDYYLDPWQAGDYIGNLVFLKQDSVVISGVTFSFCQESSSLTIDGNSLSNFTFKFALLDEANTYLAEFKPSNIEIDVGS